MKPWRDGLGRYTIKAPTGTARPQEFVFDGDTPLGVCRAPGWVIIYGPVLVSVGDVTAEAIRSALAVRARRRRWPGWMRWEPRRDPRVIAWMESR